MEEIKEERETIDKTALKNFAMNSRTKLMQNIEMQLNAMGFYADKREVTPQYEDDRVYKLHDREFSQKSRTKIKEKIKENGFEKVVDEVSYTWFNRFIALYYMEVNEYISEKILSNIDSLSKYASVLTREMNVDEKQKIADCILNNKDEELLKTLLIRECNRLSEKLPFLFEKFEDYTEELFPTGLFTTNSVIRNMVELDDKNWHEVEVIGWIYQYYITDKKNEVFANLKKNKKIEKEDIPAATQIFTPKWIVKYMVENSLGKLWLESHPNEELKSKFKYYLESAEQEEDVKKQLDSFIDKNLMPENITVLDPACGSGHILVVAFEVLYQIYKSYGYIEEDIPELILKNNLFGIDICGRAFQLAQMALVMSARKYDKNIFDKIKELNIVKVENSNWIDTFIEQELLQGVENERQAKEQIDLLKTTFYDADEYGSIIKVKGFDFDFWNKKLDYLNNLPESYQATFNTEIIKDKLPKLIKQIKIMQNTYHCCIANPPYMGSRGMNDNLSKFLKKHYFFSKGDMFAVFIELIQNFTKKNYYNATVNQNSWMFLGTYEQLRTKFLNSICIDTMVYLGTHAFEEIGGEVVQTTTYITKNLKNNNYIGKYIKLIDYKNAQLKEKKFLEHNKSDIYLFKQIYFLKIPKKSICFWISNKFIENFLIGKTINDFGDNTTSQNKTADNDKYLRFLWEVDKNNIGKDKKWVLYAKGGEYRKYFGNIEYIIDFSPKAIEFYKTNKTSNLLEKKYWYVEGITFTKVTTKGLSFRYLPPNCIFDMGGPSICFLKDKIYYFLGFFNSKIANMYVRFLNPTINTTASDINNIPIILPKEENIKKNIENMVKENIKIAKDDWDSFETSLDFKTHPLLIYSFDGKIKTGIETYNEIKKENFEKLKKNETKLNEIFINLYGLQKEITPEIENKDITLKSSIETEKDCIQSLLSYFIGCIFGRYDLSLHNSFSFAGGNWEENYKNWIASKNKSLTQDLLNAINKNPELYPYFKPNEDNIIPILSKDYFHDDIITRLKEFLKAAFGAETLSVNLDYIADVLGRKGLESAEERIRKYFLNDFYKDHLQRYKKRPIYWQITSGKEKAFNALVYLHRYDKSTLSTARTKCLQYQEKIDTELNMAKQNNDVKQQNILEKYKEELIKFDDRLKNLADQQIELDLDDGVKVNYAKFKGILDSEKEIIGKDKE